MQDQLHAFAGYCWQHIVRVQGENRPAAQKMKRPNFFLVGAPKCGTTSAFEYLRSHPAVFMPEIKEPHYFATDLPTYRQVVSEEEYLALFDPAEEMATAIGEASVWYLWSREAAANIREFSPQARILVFFRNPIDFVQSIHAQFAFNDGLKADFPGAWRNPSSASELTAMAAFGSQYRHLLEIFPQRQVLPVLLDDLQAEPRKQYLRMLEFLGLADDGKTEFGVYNTRKAHRSLWVRRLAQETPEPIAAAWTATKRILGIGHLGLMDRIVDLNEKSAAREEVDSRLRVQLRETFKDDVTLLSGLLGRDLSHWQ